MGSSNFCRSQPRAKDTPATERLGKCKDAPIPTGTINYRSVVGMLLMYLVGNTRPDCAFATHQCAHFSHEPRLPHEVALKRIGRYLKGTRDGGIILRPSASLRLDCYYVDADFAGLRGHEAKDKPSSGAVKSSQNRILHSTWHRPSSTMVL